MATTSSGLRYPASSAAPNVSQDIQNLASDADAKVLPAYANITARNTAIPSPTQGRACTVAGVIHTYDGSGWRWAKRGYGIVTTDAGGNIVVTHGLGATPTGVLLTSGPQASDLLNRIVTMNYTGSDGTNFVIYVKRDDTNALLASNTVAFAWEAFV